MTASNRGFQVERSYSIFRSVHDVPSILQQQRQQITRRRVILREENPLPDGLVIGS